MLEAQRFKYKIYIEISAHFVGYILFYTQLMQGNE